MVFADGHVLSFSAGEPPLGSGLYPFFHLLDFRGHDLAVYHFLHHGLNLPGFLDICVCVYETSEVGTGRWLPCYTFPLPAIAAFIYFLFLGEKRVLNLFFFLCNLKLTL